MPLGATMKTNACVTYGFSGRWSLALGGGERRLLKKNCAEEDRDLEFMIS
jgi:hypothetical protein